MTYGGDGVSNTLGTAVVPPSFLPSPNQIITNFLIFSLTVSQFCLALSITITTVLVLPPSFLARTTAVTLHTSFAPPSLSSTLESP